MLQIFDGYKHIILTRAHHLLYKTQMMAKNNASPHDRPGNGQLLRPALSFRAADLVVLMSTDVGYKRLCEGLKKMNKLAVGKKPHGGAGSPNDKLTDITD